MWSFLLAFIPRAIVQGIPLLYGSTGEIITEKSGNLNLGIPGVMYVGGICGVIGSFFYERSAGGAANMNGFLAIAIPMLCCLLGSLLGMLSVLILSQLGYVAALSGVIMAVCVLKGYEMLGGKLTKKAVVISAVIMILMTYFADRVDWAIILFNQGGGAEAGYSLFECYRLIPAALSAEIIDMGSYIGNLVLQYLFVALGAIPTVIGKMKEKKEEGIIARLN